MSRQRQDAFVEGVDDPFLLRVEGFFHFGARHDPVAGTNHGYRSVEMVEGQLGDVGGDGVREGSALSGVGGDQDFTGLFDAFDQRRIVERIEEANVDHFAGDIILLL